jgi:hypothetical protein
MRRRKRFSIKIVALGFAVSALLAAPAQAGLDEGIGWSKQSEAATLQLGADDRALLRMSTPTLEPNVVVSPDDRAVNRISPDTWSQPTTVATSDDGYGIVDFGIGGTVLLLGAAAILVAARHVQNGRLAST